MAQQNIIIYKTHDNKASVALYAQDGEVRLTQKQLAKLFATSRSGINEHISNILIQNELDENSVVRNFRTTASDGKTYNVLYYALPMILAIGFRVGGVRGTRFRQWANRHLREYLVKGFVMDDERLKNPDGRPDYFDEMLARIRDIRASEKRFYQKVRDLFALSVTMIPAIKPRKKGRIWLVSPINARAPISRVFRDARRHPGADFFAIMKSEHEVGITRPGEGSVGGCPLHYPAVATQCGQNAPCLCARPAIHAAVKRIWMGSTGCSPVSIRSATARRVRASARAMASSLVLPYFIAPGISVISAIQRPSLSRSVSTVNCMFYLYRIGSESAVLSQP